MIRSQSQAKSLKSKTQSKKESSVCPKLKVPNVSGNDSFVEVFKSYKGKSANANTECTSTKSDCLWSDEDNSPPSNKLNSRNDGIPINGLKNTSTSNVASNGSCLDSDLTNNSSESKKTDVSVLLKDNGILYCPICLKSNNFDQSSGFVVHLKNCAFKNKVSTEQLIQAIQLQEKQTTERIALGLPIIKKEKSNVKRNIIRKGTIDSNLDLAIALSTSLRESEMLSKLKASETLLEAGLEQEAMSQCKQLEDFGFMSSKPTEIPVQKSVRSRNNHTTVLFTRSQQERERIITEKIAMILVDSDSEPQLNDVVVDSHFHVLKSSYLMRLRDEPLSLWKKSYQMDELTNEECYYVENLSRFVSPCKVEAGAKLKHVSQIPCRPVSPERKNESRDLKTLAALFKPKQKTVTQNLIKKFDQVDEPKSGIDSRMATDWKCLINEKFMSDLTIYVKEEKSIYAHKLVFHARCRSILSETIKEEEKDKCTEILMWLEYCYEGVIAFLEYIYTGCVPILKKLQETEVEDLKSICVRYGFIELKELIERLDTKDEIFKAEQISEPENSYYRTIRFEKPVIQYEGEPHNSLADKQGLVSEEGLKIREIEELSSPEMFSMKKDPSPDPFQVEIYQEVQPESETREEEIDVLDSLINRSFTPTKNLANEGNLDVLQSSTEKSISETESTMHNLSRSIIEDILSDLCSPPTKKSDFEELPEKVDAFETNENAMFDNFENLDQYVLSQPVLNDGVQTDDVICLSSSEDEQDAIITQSEMEATHISSRTRFETTAQCFKRKSFSPLEKSQTKKTKRRSYRRKGEAESSNDELLEEKPKRTKTAGRIRKRKAPLSQTLTLSASDSDASLYKFDIAVPSSYRADSCNSGAEKNESEETNNLNSKSQRSPVRLDDFQDLMLGEQIENDFLKKYGKNERWKANDVSRPVDMPSDTSPYVSPVWDGFEHANDDYYGMKYSSESCHSNDFLTSLTATSSPNTPSKRNSLPDARYGESLTFADHHELKKDPSFGSFCIDESLLSRIESDHRTEQARTQEVKVAKTIDVKKLKRRSRSDTSAAPRSRKRVVTPCPDYDNMTPLKLKQALDGYGIKTGLSRPKAVKLLKYIYDRLHFDQDESESRTQLEKAKKTVRIMQEENSVRRQQPNKLTYAISSDSDDLGKSVTSYVVLEESIMEDEDDDCPSGNANATSKSVSIDTAFRGLLKEDKAFHTQILLYEPIWIEPLKQRLKEKGVKCSMNSLKDYLDEKCITFRTERQWGSRRKKRTRNVNSQPALSQPC